MVTTARKWKPKPLKDITSKIGSGATPRGGKNGYKTQGISLIRSLNVYDFSFSEDDLAFIGEEQAAELNNVVVQENDILLNITGASVARCCMVSPKYLPARVNQHVAIVRVRPDQADARFVLYCVNSPYLKSRLLTLAQGGATREALTKTTIENFEVPQPPLPVQRRIAGILSAYDDLIENNQRRIQILETMARALYREWFVEFRFPGHEKIPRIASALGDIPKGWEATTLGRFVSNGSITLQTGPFGTQLKASHYTSEGTPVINVRNIGFGTVRADKFEYLPPDRVEEHKRHKLREGDIVFGRKGAVERHLLVSPNEDGWIQGSDCIRLRVQEGPLEPRFLSIAFREDEHQRWMKNQCSGAATMASLNQDILCRIPLVLPPPRLLQAFARFAASALNQGDVLSAQIQNLRRTRDLLLPRLLSGQVALDQTAA
jgi:type I restriction enzyme, S subunit